jgi:4-diphosphocytidyl-2-C-methyl-D-erythritol kinase
LTLNNLKHKIAALILDEKTDKNGIQNVLFNRLEYFVFPQYPQILEIKNLLLNLGCKSLMSGSGSTVFGIAKSLDHLEDVYENLKEYPWRTWKIQTI